MLTPDRSVYKHDLVFPDLELLKRYCMSEESELLRPQVDAATSE